MTVVEIDRLHATYDGVDEAEALRLDDALGTVAAAALDAALLEVEIGHSYAVCIRELTFSFDADLRLPVRELARRWAAELAARISQAARGAVGSDGLVIYDHEVDAITDILRSAGDGDRSRSWAWRQIGLLDGGLWPSPSALVALLADRPTLAPVVLTALRDEEEIPLTAQGWIAVARSVAAAFSAPLEPDRATRDGERYRPDPALGQTAPGRPVPASPEPVLATPGRTAARAIPLSVWRGASSEERRALAVLTVVMESPAHARREAAVAMATAALDRAAGAAPGADLETASNRSDPTPGPDRLQDAGRETAPATEPSSGASVGPVEESRGIETDNGGLLFLFHPFESLDLVDRAAAGPLGDVDPAVLLAWIAGDLSGVGFDDGAMVALTGRDPDRLAESTEARAELDAAGRAELAALVALTEDWLLARLDHPDEGLVRLWSRPAVIGADDGWVDVEFRLRDVDIGIRRAGLDLDPGFVWWIGAVVRFRYV